MILTVSQQDKVSGIYLERLLHRLVELFPTLAHVEDSTLIYPHYTRLNMLFGDVSYDWSKQYACHVWRRIGAAYNQVH